MDVRKPPKRIKGKQSCFVPDCNTSGYVTDNGKTVTFHVLPTDAKLLKIWIVKIGRDVGPLFKITSHTKICSRHFIDSDFRVTYRGQKFLKPDSTPSLFNRNNSRWKDRVTKNSSSTATATVTSNDHNYSESQPPKL